MRVRIESDDGRRVLMKPLSRLAEAAEKAFLWAARGALYNRVTDCYVGSWEALPGIIARLKNQRFEVELSPSVMAMVEGNVDQLRKNVEQARARVKSNAKHLYPFQRTGVVKLASRRRFLLGDDMGLGKSLAVTEPVLTPDGFVPIGDLSVGDDVIGSDGHATKVTGVFPQGVMELFTVVFGGYELHPHGLQHWWKQAELTRVTCSLDHLWYATIYNQTFSERGVFPLDTILRRSIHGARIAVPRLHHLIWSPIVDIESVEPGRAVCISVAAPDGLFVARDYILTHNTRQAIFAIPAKSPVVVVSPASVKGEWRQQFKDLREEFTVNVVSGKGKFSWPREREVKIINPDILPAPPLAACLYRIEGVTRCTKIRRYGKVTCGTHRKEYPNVDQKLCVYCGSSRHLGMDCLEMLLGAAPGGLTVIVDEAHLYKDAKAKRTLSLRVLCAIARSRGGHSWGLTGTPVVNDPDELWTVLENLDLAGEAFYTYDKFVELFRGKRNYFGGYVWPDYRKVPVPPEAIEHLSTVMLRRNKDDELNLPPKTYHDIPVDLSAALKRECDDYIREAALDVTDDRFLDKVPFTEYATVRKNLATAKIPALEDFLKLHAGEPMVVFSAHRAPIDIFDGRKGATTITGSVKAEDRSWRAKAFQDGKYDIIAGTIDTMGVGLTLTRARHMIFLDLEWTPAAQWQAEDRIRRIGQEFPVWIHRLVGDHVLERRIAEILAKKTAMVDVTIGSVEVDDRIKLDELDMEGITVNRGMDILQPLTDEEMARLEKKNPRRPAKQALEKWAHAGLVKLVTLDQDRAQKRNGMGFMRMHTEPGHSLANQLTEHGGLTDVQWRAAVSICRNYWRQIGIPPGVRG